jgi:hypothetical protein
LFEGARESKALVFHPLRNLASLGRHQLLPSGKHLLRGTGMGNCSLSHLQAERVHNCAAHVGWKKSWSQHHLKHAGLEGAAKSGSNDFFHGQNSSSMFLIKLKTFWYGNNAGQQDRHVNNATEVVPPNPRLFQMTTLQDLQQILGCFKWRQHSSLIVKASHASQITAAW